MKKRNFEEWLWEDLEIEFGLTQETLVRLDTWLKNDCVISETEKTQINFLSRVFQLQYRNWNEDELKMQFIAPLLTIFNYYEIGFTPFSQRSLQAQIGDWDIMGRVDWLLATGKQTPRKPYVFLLITPLLWGARGGVEITNDPLGQLLSEMLVAQTLNADENPIYGIYIVGKDWNFVVLEDTHYAVSRPYQANEDPDLEVIVKALKEIKNILPK